MCHSALWWVRVTINSVQPFNKHCECGFGKLRASRADSCRLEGLKLVLLGQQQRQPHWTPGCWLWTLASFLFMEILPQTKKKIIIQWYQKEKSEYASPWWLKMRLVNESNVLSEWMNNNRMTSKASKKYTVINEQVDLCDSAQQAEMWVRSFPLIDKCVCVKRGRLYFFVLYFLKMWFLEMT